MEQKPLVSHLSSPQRKESGSALGLLDNLRPYQMSFVDVFLRSISRMMSISLHTGPCQHPSGRDKSSYSVYSLDQGMITFTTFWSIPVRRVCELSMLRQLKKK